jgi:hypothetical protein
MKKLLSLLFLLVSIFSVNAQEQIDTDFTQNFNEVKLNALYLVIGAFDVVYERTLNDESALGINVFLPFDNDIKDDIKYYISPYYRFYFGQKYAAGFFLEGFGMLNSTVENTIYYNDGIDPSFSEKTVTDFALGIGLGGKWVTNKGFIGELSFGVGRNLFNTNEFDDDFVAKASITIGYRF